MSDDLGRSLRDAFAERPEGGQAPAGLRGRVIARATSEPLRRPAPGHAWVLRLAPAVAALIVVAAGATLFLGQRTPPGPGQPSPQPTASMAFGRLPAPVLRPAAGLGGGTGEKLVPYYGPASMTWSGSLPAAPSVAPVYRVTPAGAAEIAALETRLAGSGYRFHAVTDDPVAGLPLFYLDRDPSAAPAPAVDSAAARAAADAELVRHGLGPPWPAIVQVTPFTPLGQPAPFYAVSYQRSFDLGGGARAGLVDGAGDPEGIEVTTDAAGRVFAIHGLVPASAAEAGATYPLRAASAAAAESASQPPASSGSGSPPQVALDQGRIVYMAAGDFLEPAYLFSGRFTLQQVEYEKRVLVPAVEPAGLTPT